jgi:calcineurin-like phosphoesterase family protein
MSRHIVKLWNQTVAEDDVLYCLGDWSFGGIQNIWNFRKQLRCKTIHLIYGNHDNHIKNYKILPNCMHDFENRIIVDGDISKDIETQYDGYNSYTNEVHGREVFTSTQDVLMVKHGKHEFFLSHYPHLSWYHASRGVIMLHGHEHGHLDHLNKDCRRLDVGIDTAKKLLGEYRPFSIEEVISIVNKKAPLILGHHEGQH